MIFDIKIRYPGLGDQLFYSAIPELLKREFPNSSVNITLSRGSRNSETANFIWGENPFVDSVCFCAFSARQAAHLFQRANKGG